MSTPASDAKPATPPRPTGIESRPVEFDHFMREAQMMRAEHMATIIDGWFRGFTRLFRRPRSETRAHPVRDAAARTV